MSGIGPATDDYLRTEGVLVSLDFDAEEEQ